MKILLAALTITILILPVNSYAHPDFMGAKIQWSNHTEIPHTINVIKKTSQIQIEYEMLSVQWFWQNFTLLLGMSITMILLPTFMIIYSEDISKKLIRK